MTDDPRAALMAALREMAEDWCVAGMEYAEEVMAAKGGVPLSDESKEEGRRWVRDWFSDVAVVEDERLQAVLAAVDAIEAAARKPEARCPWMEDEWGTWTTGCGRKWQYEVGGPADNDARYCHGCGGVIEAASFPALPAGE